MQIYSKCLVRLQKLPLYYAYIYGCIVIENP
jgi:hypothetical protein